MIKNMHELRTTIKFESWNDWVVFLKFLVDNDIKDMQSLESEGFIIFDDPDGDLDEYPDISESTLNKKGIELGVYFIWLESTFDRMGSVGCSIIVKVDSNIQNASEWCAKAKNGFDKDFVTY
jgi:hypothetical protein